MGLLVVLLVVLASTPVLASPNFMGADDGGLLTIINPIGDDAYVAGGEVVIDSKILGDLFVAGGTVEINADVTGDLFIVGGQISVRGSVGDDVRIGGGSVTLHGNVGDDVLVAAGTITIADTSVIRGDLLVGTGSFNLYGNVLGNVRAGFNEGRIRGTIGGDADLRYSDGKLSFADGAKIDGKLDYWAQYESTVFDDVAKEVEYHKWVVANTSSPWSAAAIVVPVAVWSGALWSLVGIFLLGGLLILLLPKYLPRVANTIKRNYGAALWQGILFAVAIPLLALLIALTGFGIPVSIVVMLGFLIIMFLASVPISLTLGSYIIKYTEKDRSRQFGALVAGATIYIIMGLLPFVGWIIKLILFVIGIGAIWIDIRMMIKKGIY